MFSFENDKITTAFKDFLAENLEFEFIENEDGVGERVELRFKGGEVVLPKLDKTDNENGDDVNTVNDNDNDSKEESDEDSTSLEKNYNKDDINNVDKDESEDKAAETDSEEEEKPLDSGEEDPANKVSASDIKTDEVNDSEDKEKKNKIILLESAVNEYKEKVVSLTEENESLKKQIDDILLEKKQTDRVRVIESVSYSTGIDPKILDKFSFESKDELDELASGLLKIKNPTAVFTGTENESAIFSSSTSYPGV